MQELLNPTEKKEKKEKVVEEEKVGDLNLDKDINAREGDKIMDLLARYRSITGVLASGFGNMDLKFASFSM